jgi:hypothetical protein
MAASAPPSAVAHSTVITISSVVVVDVIAPNAIKKDAFWAFLKST